MNEENDIKKSLAKITRDEKGWRKSMTSAEGSYSKDFAQVNLHRLEALRQVLLTRLTSLEARRQQVMKSAVADGIFTDHIRDGVCEQLVTEGLLIRADPLPRRHVKSIQQVYVPTEQAVQEWQIPDSEIDS
jgi:uncharacterized caspase-like protein